MVFEYIEAAKPFLSSLFGNEITLLIVFVVFVFLAYKVFKMIIKMAIAGIAGAAFPIVANKVFGLAIPLTISSIASYALLAIALLEIYLAIYGLYKLAKYATWPFRSHKKVVVKEK